MKKTEGYGAVLGFSVGGWYRCINSNSPEKFAIMKYSFTKQINIAVRLLGPPRAEDLFFPLVMMYPPILIYKYILNIILYISI